MSSDSLPLLQIENLDSARFRCVFPECGGLCCKQGRPGMTPGDIARVESNLEKFLPHLRPKSRKALARRPWLSKLVKDGLPTLEVVDGWCVFHNEGCVLHKVGLEEGDAFRYKPEVCARFPIEPVPGEEQGYFVRQWGHREEAWDLFCLNPEQDPAPAKETLAGEIDFVRRLQAGQGAP